MSAAASGDVANEADLAACFRLLLGRAPGVEEWTGHCTLLGQPLRAVVQNYLDSPEHARLVHKGAGAGAHLALTQLEGFALYTDDRDLAVGAHVAGGGYESEIAATLRRYLKPGMVMVDIGANIGLFTMLGASLVGPSGAVLAVEPNPANTRMIEASRRANGFAQVTIAGCAVGRAFGLLALETQFSNGATSDPAGDLAGLFAARLVPSLPLSRLLPERRIDFIKIDCEGAEHTALGDVQERLRRDRPVIVSELNPHWLQTNSGVSGSAYLGLLRGLGYQFAVVAPDGPVACADAEAVMARYEQSGQNHIDLLLTPAPARGWWRR